MRKENLIIEYCLDPGLKLLPKKMDTDKARIMLITIGLQESRFEHRTQIGGPAHGFWQFEKGGGVRGVLNHYATKNYAENICSNLLIDKNEDVVYDAITYNDPLACAMARLLLWTIPYSLPEIGDKDTAWDQYISVWRPGKPHRDTWNDLYNEALLKFLKV